MMKRPPAKGGEDFAFLAQARRGCFTCIGTNKPGETVVPLHNPRFDFNYRVLPVGAAHFATVVEEVLAPINMPN